MVVTGFTGPGELAPVDIHVTIGAVVCADFRFSELQVQMTALATDFIVLAQQRERSSLVVVKILLGLGRYPLIGVVAGGTVDIDGKLTVGTHRGLLQSRQDCRQHQYHT